MSKLLDKQLTLFSLICRLGIFAESLGYQAKFSYAKRCDDCKVGLPNSNHKIALAVDIDLFRDGKYLSSGEEHGVLHDYWELIGGAPRIPGDLNHYSLEHNGVR